MSSTNLDQDEQDYKQLQNYMPKDLLNMIIGYVPLIDMIWDRSKSKDWLGSNWDTDLIWQGQFTYGTWTASGASICADYSIIERYDTFSNDNDSNNQEDQFEFPCSDFQSVLSMLKCEKGHKVVKQSQVFDALYTFYNGDLRKFDDFDFNHTHTYLMQQHWHVVIIYIIKVPLKSLINELQFIHDSFTRHPHYNKQVLTFRRPKRQQ